MPARPHKVFIARKVANADGPSRIYLKSVSLPDIPGRDDIVVLDSPHGRCHTVLHRRMRENSPDIYVVVKPDNTHYRKRDRPFAEICAAYEAGDWLHVPDWKDLYDDGK